MSDVEAAADAVLVVDAHTHAFSPELIGDRQRVAEKEPWFDHLYRDTNVELVEAEATLASMTSAGVTHTVICGFPWTDIDRCRAENDYLHAVCAAHPGRLSWLAAVPPGHRDAGRETLRAMELGAVGVGELNADGQGFDLDDPGPLRAAMGVLRDWNRPVLIHCSEPVGHLYPGKGKATPDQVLSFVAEYRENDIIAAHWGGGLPFYELMPEVAQLCQRVWYDTAASTYLYRFDVFSSVLGIVGGERVLFASDFPVLRQDRFLQRVRDLGIDSEAETRLLATNAIHLFRFDTSLWRES